MSDTQETTTDHYIELTAEIVSAYVANNHVQPSELEPLIRALHATLNNLSKAAEPSEPEVERPTPGQIRKSITPDALISFIDGKPYKTLKRHLTKHGLDISGYRERFGLPADYPTTAVNYSAARSALALALGLGRSRGAPASAEADGPAPTPVEGPAAGTTRRRSKKADPAE